MVDIIIENAVESDAPLIARAIMDAVGEELVRGLAGDRTVEDVYNLFEGLARRTDTQYSYLNTRIARLPDGTRAGVCVSYDGGRIFELRRSFFKEARRILGWTYTDEETEAFPGETGEDEFYLDSLAVLPEYRGRGIGRALIMDAARRAAEAGLPLGLLVADGNEKARKLYESCGLRAAGRRFFAGEEMTNMRLNVDPRPDNFSN